MTQTSYDATYEGRDGVLYQVKMIPPKDQSGIAPEHRVIGGTSSATVVAVLNRGRTNSLTPSLSEGQTVTDIMPRFRKVAR